MGRKKQMGARETAVLEQVRAGEVGQVVLKLVNPARKQNRRYVITLQPGLAESFTVYREYGSRASRKSHAIIQKADSDAAAREQAARHLRWRLLHGYVITDVALREG